MTAHREKPNKLSYSIFINTVTIPISMEHNLLQQHKVLQLSLKPCLQRSFNLI